MSRLNKISKSKKWLEGRSKIRTGFCGNGHCEGDRPKNHKGEGLKTCHLFLTCPCECHEKLDKMYEEMGMVRLLVLNPEYHPVKGNFVMPDPAEILAQRRAREIEAGKESIALAEPEEILSGNVFTGTATGRRSRGQLEYQVLIACTALGWPDASIFPITTKWVSEYIAERERIMPPSTGAIQAIWDRWVKYNFATYEKKPVRFTGFTDTETKPTVDSLDLARDKYKRDEKLKQLTKNRTMIRGQR